jgi:hypothetical protein
VALRVSLSEATAAQPNRASYQRASLILDEYGDLRIMLPGGIVAPLDTDAAESGAHPDLATHDTLGLATDAELGSAIDVHAATPHGGVHPDLGTHDDLGLATQAELDAVAAAKANTQHAHVDADIPAGIARDTEVATAVSDHEAAANPHPTYETSAEAQAKVDAHAGAVDPHTAYQRENEKGQINGYAGLDAGGTVPDAQIPASIARDSEIHAESHAARHAAAGADEITPSAIGASATGHTHAHADTTGQTADQHHARQHSITSASDHTFPGGSTFLRADGTFASPPGGSEAFPVGSVFIAVVSTNPATLLGYGTWSAFGAGRVLVGLDAGQTEFDTVEETGGAKIHTLTEAEMPAHVHNQTRLPTATGGVTGFTVDTSMSGTPATTGVDTGSKGGGGAHNNLQPYIVVYMWKRTA